MAKIVGIRERVGGATGLLGRTVQGVGFYEPAGAAEQQYSPYDIAPISAFGATAPYELGVPGRVAEIKRVLIELNKFWSDPNLNPSSPQVEDTFKHIDTSPQFIDAWDGPTADSFALTVGRHRDRYPAFMPSARREPLIQLPKFQDVHGRDVVVGGPQPTVAGLELLAQAAHEVLKDTVQLDQYLAWRGGGLDCATSPTDCVPPDSLVRGTPNAGRAWNPRGWTVAWRDGPVAKASPELIDQLDLIEQSLETSWMLAPHESDEPSRKKRADAIAADRLARHELVEKLNEGAPLPSCADPAKIYDKDQGACMPRCRPDQSWDESLQRCVVEVSPTKYASYAECMTDQLKIGTEAEAEAACRAIFPADSKTLAVAVGLAAAAGVGGYLLFRDKKIPAMVGPR